MTLASVYFSVQLATAPAPSHDAKNELELVSGEALTIPMISNGVVNGYFIGKVSFMMHKEQAQKVKIPLTPLTTDELFTLLVGNPVIDISDTNAFDLVAFRETIKKDLNQRLGGDFIADVLVEQLDYLAREDIKDATSRQSRKLAKAVNIVAPAPVEAKTPSH